MSKGPGAVERTILKLLADNPDRAFSVIDIGSELYGHPLCKKHRVSILRAIHSLARKRRDIGYCISSFGAAVYNLRSLRGHALAGLKTDWVYCKHSEALLAEHLSTWGAAKLAESTGEWWLGWQIAIAERDSDTARLAVLEVEQRKAFAAQWARAAAIMGARP
jgi:hypothetical protein